MNYLYLLILIILSPFISFGQSDYFLTDSLKSSGIKLIEGKTINNPQFCQIKKGKKILKYSPNEIKGFGFADGRTYISKNIYISDSLQKVFLEEVQKGKISLYAYKNKGFKTFFVKKDSSLFIEIPKKKGKKTSYRKQIQNITNDCSNVEDAAKLVKYHKKSLSELINRYNNCEKKYFQHFRYGLTFGYELLKFNSWTSNVLDEVNFLDFKYEGNPFTGLFFDKPFTNRSFSLHFEINYSKQSFSYFYSDINRDIDFVSDFSLLSLPLTIKYVYPSNNIRPFINLGIEYSRIIYGEFFFFSASKTNNTVRINNIIRINPLTSSSTKLIDENQFGFTVGGGTEFRLNYRHSLIIELRYRKLMSPGISSFLSISAINLSISLNI